MFGNIKIEKKKDYSNKIPVSLRDVDIEKVWVSNKIPFGYDRQIKWTQFLIEKDDLLEKHNTIWDKVSADIKRNLIASLPIIKNF